MRPIALLLGLMIVSSLSAEEVPLKIETDLKAQYFVVARGGSPEQQVLLLKRVRPGSTIYSKRLFDCEAHTYQSLGSWESLDAITAACPETGMEPIEEGTIAFQLWQYACGGIGAQTTPAEQLTPPPRSE
jgi:hypothetical protein